MVICVIHVLKLVTSVDKSINVDVDVWLSVDVFVCVRVDVTVAEEVSTMAVIVDVVV